jgi:hypothetical protein
MTILAARSVLVTGALLALCLLIVGCTSPEKKVAKRMDELKVQWQTNLAHQANLPERILDWPAARQLMLENNLKLRSSRTDVTNAIENYRQIYRELVPTLNARAGVSKTLARLDTLSPDDVTFSADSFFNIPGLVNFASRIYVGKLMMLRARTAYSLVEREQTIELYRLFTGVQEYQIEVDKLAVQRANASAMRQIDPFTGRMLETELQIREISAQKEDRDLQQRASDLLGVYTYKWVLAPNGLPDLRYNAEPLPLSDSNRVAQLQLKLVALELEAARMTLLGMKMRYWPELNIFISGPPVYQRVAGQDRWWDAEQVRGSADLFWQLDTRGYISRQLKQTRRSQALQKQRFEQESLGLMDRLIFTQDLLKKTQEQLDRTEKEIEFLLAIPPAQNFLSVQKYIADYRQLTQQQIRLRHEISEFNAFGSWMNRPGQNRPLSLSHEKPGYNPPRDVDFAPHRMLAEDAQSQSIGNRELRKSERYSWLELGRLSCRAQDAARDASVHLASPQPDRDQLHLGRIAEALFNPTANQLGRRGHLGRIRTRHLRS